jgi:hypothetical protein
MDTAMMTDEPIARWPKEGGDYYRDTDENSDMKVDHPGCLAQYPERIYYRHVVDPQRIAAWSIEPYLPERFRSDWVLRRDEEGNTFAAHKYDAPIGPEDEEVPIVQWRKSEGHVRALEDLENQMKDECAMLGVAYRGNESDWFNAFINSRPYDWNGRVPLPFLHPDGPKFTKEDPGHNQCCWIKQFEVLCSQQ